MQWTCPIAHQYVLTNQIFLLYKYSTFIFSFITVGFSPFYFIHSWLTTSLIHEILIHRLIWIIWFLLKSDVPPYVYNFKTHLPCSHDSNHTINPLCIIITFWVPLIFSPQMFICFIACILLLLLYWWWCSQYGFIGSTYPQIFMKFLLPSYSWGFVFTIPLHHLCLHVCFLKYLPV